TNNNKYAKYSNSNPICLCDRRRLNVHDWLRDHRSWFLSGFSATHAGCDGTFSGGARAANNSSGTRAGGNETGDYPD
ncbi:MAG TPA: hypothetical protein VF430_08765, partial [Verrucomicrobiae bacterium]